MLISDGLVAFVKSDCPTCALIEPVLRALAASGSAFRVVSQDDPGYPAGIAAIVDDRERDHSYLNGIESTPTLIRFEGGRETARVAGWDCGVWRRMTGVADLGEGLPSFRPG